VSWRPDASEGAPASALAGGRSRTSASRAWSRGPGLCPRCSQPRTVLRSIPSIDRSRRRYCDSVSDGGDGSADSDPWPRGPAGGHGSPSGDGMSSSVPGWNGQGLPLGRKDRFRSSPVGLLISCARDPRGGPVRRLCFAPANRPGGSLSVNMVATTGWTLSPLQPPAGDAQPPDDTTVTSLVFRHARTSPVRATLVDRSLGSVRGGCRATGAPTRSFRREGQLMLNTGWPSVGIVIGPTGTRILGETPSESDASLSQEIHKIFRLIAQL
jgi:hypothetical protein